MGVGVRSAPIVRVPVSVYAFFFSLNFAEFVERGSGEFFWRWSRCQHVSSILAFYTRSSIPRGAIRRNSQRFRAMLCRLSYGVVHSFFFFLLFFKENYLKRIILQKDAC